MLDPSDPLPFYLYRHYAKDGTLLYVGVSLSAAERLHQHMTKSPWAREIDTIKVQTFSDKAEALDAEKKAIILERPLWNDQFNRSVNKRHRNQPRRYLQSTEHQAPLPLCGFAP